MKKLIFLELAFIFLATTFSSSPPPPGWYQQTLPVNDQINDIFFLDSLNGWVVTYGRINPPDTAYIMNTTNGGTNWNLQFSFVNDFLAIQFTDENTGYVCGGFGIGTLFKTTNEGTNWNNIAFGSTNRFADLCFISNDTGWVCSDDSFDGGVFKTTNGGISWSQQLNLGIGNPLNIFFVNSDTGWFTNNFEQLYKTINGGINWNIVFTSPYNIDAIFFLNSHRGWMRGAATTSNIIGISYTTNGGLNWFDSQGNTIGGFDVKFVNDSVGFSGTFASFKVMKSTDEGKNWGYQSSPVESGNLIATVLKDTMNAWAGQLMHTNEGGGEIIITEVKEITNSMNKNFILKQNYPNPFNPNTVIRYGLTANSFVRLKIFDIKGREIKTLVNQRQNSGEYKIEFNGSDINSGVYFYQLEVTGNKTNETFSETKKMLLVK
jgi:photosystem II stability/assembly factor-like uncharacterized protein